MVTIWNLRQELQFMPSDNVRGKKARPLLLKTWEQIRLQEPAGIPMSANTDTAIPTQCLSYIAHWVLWTLKGGMIFED